MTTANRQAKRDAAWEEQKVAWRCPAYRPHADTRGACDACGTSLTGRKTVWCGRACEAEWLRQHQWTVARSAALRLAGRRCTHDGCDVTVALEVNHIEPRRGRGYGLSCAHHQDNLEVLCHQHHLERTAAQRAAGLLG